MSYYDMARDAGYTGDEARQYAQLLEEDHMRQAYEVEAERRAAEWAAEHIAPFVDDDGVSLHGVCGHCDRTVDNYDEGHRVTSIVRGGRGVECFARGDITVDETAPLRRVDYNRPASNVDPAPPF